MKQVTYIVRHDIEDMRSDLQELYESGWRLIGPVQAFVADTADQGLETAYGATLERGEDEVRPS